MNTTNSITENKCLKCPVIDCPRKRLLEANFQPRNRQERHALAKIMRDLELSIIPVPIGQKFPNIPWKEYQTRMATDDELHNWFMLQDNTIGIVTGKISSLVVVDLDSEDSLKWARQNLPYTGVKVKTSRGQHWYYTYPQMALHIKNKVKIDIEGLFLDLDIRADGGLVMGFGAVHPSGIFYEPIFGEQDV